MSAQADCAQRKYRFHPSPNNAAWVTFPLSIADDAEPGVSVITADIASDDFNLKQWAEALVKIE